METPQKKIETSLPPGTYLLIVSPHGHGVWLVKGDEIVLDGTTLHGLGDTFERIKREDDERTAAELDAMEAEDE